MDLLLDAPHPQIHDNWKIQIEVLCGKYYAFWSFARIYI